MSSTYNIINLIYMEPQTSNQGEQQPTIKVINTSAWYSPLCRISTFSRIAIALVVIALPFVGGYVGYRTAVSQFSTTEQDISSLIGSLEIHEPQSTTSTSTPELVANPATTTVALVPFFDRKADWSKTVMEHNEGGVARVGAPGDCVVPGSGTDRPWGEGCAGRYISDKYEIVSHYKSCGGCEVHYLQERQNPRSAVKLDSFSTFAGAVFDKTALTPYLIGLTKNKLFTFDLKTATERIIYEAKPNEVLLICEHGCAPANSEMSVALENGLLNLDMLVFDENPFDDSPSGPVGEKRRFGLPLN